jgi:hypothetical protein
MSYEIRTLQFGTETAVPDNPSFHPVDDLAPVKHQIGGAGHLWDLSFSFESPAPPGPSLGFYLASDHVPGKEGALIKAWYVAEGTPKPPGPHVLSLVPFIIHDGSGEFAQATHFVNFSEASTSDSSINTDTIQHPTVTATVHASLPGAPYETVSVSSHGTSHSIVTTTTKTQAVFDHIFVYSGSNTPSGSSLTVNKGQSCFALAVFKLVSSSSTSEVDTYQFPKIREWEWPMVVQQIIREVATVESGTIFEYLNAKQIASLQPDAQKTAIAAINNRIAQLERVKAQIPAATQRTGA